MKKLQLIIIIVVTILMLNSCNLDINIGEISKNKLKYEEIEKCKITKICDLNNLNYKVDKVNVSKEELEECITEELEQYYRYEEITDRNYVKKGDYITISYISKCGDEIIDKSNSRKLKVGAGNFDIQVEKSIIGAIKNKKFKVTITIPDNEENKSIAGKKEVIEIKVLSITKLIVPKITDKWVKVNYGYKTVNEFYETIKGKYIRQEEAFATLNAKEKLLNDAIEASSYELNEDSVLEYAKKLYYEEDNKATGYGSDLEEYVKSFYNMDLDGFYQQCYDNAELEIKRILLIGAISENKKINVNKQDFNEYLDKYSLSPDKVTKEEKSLYKYEVLETKVIEYIVDLVA
ncbi:MAG: hypothetical protein ACI4HO_07425 [Ruminococcus sp.]